MPQTKSEVLEELTGEVGKDELVEIVGSKLKKDELAQLLDDDSGATKEELVHKLRSRTKQELADQLASHATKDELQRVLERARDHGETGRPKDRDAAADDDQGRAGAKADVDWNAELDWAPPPRPTPAPVTFVGAAPFLPGQRVRVDLAGLPMLGVFAGKGASAAGTIVGVDARERSVRVFLDAVFDGRKELVVPPERVVPDG
jgi:hypothetical protein